MEGRPGNRQANLDIYPQTPAHQGASLVTQMLKKQPAMQKTQNSWSGRSLGEGNDSPLQYSCLEYSMDGGAWRAGVHGPQNHTQLSD